MKTFSIKTISPLLLGISSAISGLFLFSAFTLHAETLEEIIVTADFRNNPVHEQASSISVLDSAAISQRQAKHFEDLLNQAPNVNFAAGASRGRFVQLRGIGERSQYKDPLDPSVGLLVDNIDLSGIGLAGVLFDTKQVEILRGPQGTRFGSSAMGGMIQIVSNDPTEEPEGEISFGLGNYNSWNLAGVASGKISDSLTGRLSLSHYQSDGFIKNSFLDRDDTNNLDESAVRGKLRWLLADNTALDFSALYIRANNGYDAFSLQNNRVTSSDMPGHDRQETRGVSADLTIDGSSFSTQAIASWEGSDLAYGFDWDWTNWPAVTPYLDQWPYQGMEDNVRSRDSYSLDIRFISNNPAQFLGNADWVFGLYGYNKDVDLNYLDLYEDITGSYPSSFSSKYSSRRIASYAQLDWDLTDKISLSLGGRLENNSIIYADDVGVAASPEDTFFSANISVQYDLNDSAMLYTSINQGFKAGGVNGQAVGKAVIDPFLDPDIVNFLTSRLTFNPEKLTNYELGLKGNNSSDSVSYSLTLFYMDRKDMQANAWVLFPPADWVNYLDNVSNGKNYGLELEANWAASEKLSLSMSLGILKTELGNLTVQDVDTFEVLDQQGREQAHAPGYQYNLAATYQISSHFYANLQLDGKDRYYFSDSHNIQSTPYELIHLNLGYTLDAAEITLWVRNLLDKDYPVRGFYFANNPANGWANEPYYQYGEPRVFGISGKYNF